VQEIFINLHAHPARIRDYFGNGSSFGLKISYCEEPTLSGTAGALNGFRSSLTEPFLVQYGDVFSLLNVQALSAFHARCKAAATLVVHVSSHPEDSDIVVFAPGGRIKALLHKPGPGSQERFGNAGFYLLTPRVLDYVPRHEESDFVRDVFPRMLDDGAPLYAYETSDLLLDMGTPKRYRALMRRLGDS
jgi:NDP-sugar pyrophosphorylase family protein